MTSTVFGAAAAAMREPLVSKPDGAEIDAIGPRAGEGLAAASSDAPSGVRISEGRRREDAILWLDD